MYKMNMHYMFSIRRMSLLEHCLEYVRGSLWLVS